MTENNERVKNDPTTTNSGENSGLGFQEKTVLGISVNVLLMGFVSFFNDVSSEMITTILPLFIISIGAGQIAIGLITGLSNAVANIIKGGSGWLSDKLERRKVFAIAGYAISNVSKPLLGIQTSWQGILGLKVMDRVGKGVRVAPRDALISHYATITQEQAGEENSRSGRSFGVHRMMDTAGAIVGAFLAGFLVIFVFGTNYGAIILWSLIPGFFAVAILFFVRDVKTSEIVTPQEKKARKDKIPKDLVKLVLTLSVMEFAAVDAAFLIVRANEMMPPEWVPILYALFNAVYASFAITAGKLGDRLGKQRVIVVGLIILVGICIILAIPIEYSTTSVVVMVTSFLVFGVYMAIVDVGSKAFVSDITGKDKKGRAYGLYYLFVGLLSIPESFLFGYLYETFGFTVAFSYAAILLTIATLIFGLAKFKPKSE